MGPMYYEHKSEHPFLGQIMASDGSTSDATVHVIEEEARGLLIKALKGAKETIAAHRTSLDSLVKALLTTETLEKAELQRLLGPSANRRPQLAASA